jgi:hypothetical protein
MDNNSTPRVPRSKKKTNVIHTSQAGSGIPQYFIRPKILELVARFDRSSYSKIYENVGTIMIYLKYI